MSKNNIKIQPNTESTQESVTPVSTGNVSLQDVMELLQKQGEELQSLREQNQELSQKMDPGYEIRKSRERYDGPRTFSYGLIDGKPIVSWKTISDSQYQNPYTKKWEAKQELEITFFDGNKQTYDIVPFGNLLKRSEKTFAKEIIQKGSKTFYTFELDGNTFEVEQTFINP